MHLKKFPTPIIIATSFFIFIALEKILIYPLLTLIPNNLCIYLETEIPAIMIVMLSLMVAFIISKKNQKPIAIKNICMAFAVGVLPIIPIVKAIQFLSEKIVSIFNNIFKYDISLVDYNVPHTYQNIINSFVAQTLVSLGTYLINIFLLVLVFKFALVVGKIANKNILKLNRTHIINGVVIGLVAVLLHLSYQATIPMGGMTEIIPWLKELVVLHKYNYFAATLHYNFFPLLSIIIACKAIKQFTSGAKTGNIIE